jgi:hypothetical protein
MRRSLLPLIALPVIGLLLLPTASNVAANALPVAWQPYLWLAWPVGVLLAAPIIYGEVRQQRRQQHGLGHDQPELLRRAADDLADAVYRQWTKEAGLRSLRSPAPIRVSWSSAGQPIAADLSTVLADDAVTGRPLRLRGDIRHVTGVFRNVRARQLVIIGEPTAGKSVLALLLTLDLLRDEPVPVLLPVSSWHPHREDLHGWLTRRIVEEYPALGNADVYGPDAAWRLVAGKRVVPVLDGLDEMSDVLLPDAVDAIDRAVTDQYPLVVTCRSGEYLAAVRENGRFLAHAAVLRIHPVAIGDAENFLCGANPLAHRWQPVLDNLRADRDQPLAVVLRSPLMIDLARTVYANPAGDPGELLDPGRFADRSTIERHLLDSFLDRAYRPLPADRARAWLRFLARDPQVHDDHDIAWWRLNGSVSRWARGVSIGLTAALVLGLGEGFALGPVQGLAFALTFGLTGAVAFGYSRPRTPSRIEVRFRGNGLALLRRLAASVAIGIVLSAVAGLVNGLIYAVVFMAALTAHLWLDTPPDTTTAAGPMDVLRQDRRAALILGGALALAFVPETTASMTSGPSAGLGVTNWAAVVLLSLVLGAVIGIIMGGFVFGRVGAVAFGIAGAATGGITVSTEQTQWLPALAAGVVFGLVIGGGAVLSRAWGAFAFARLWLALRGWLPLRLMRFLGDAHQRGVLRQSGTVYQFRHDRIQEHIAADRQAPRPSMRESAAE